MSIEDFRLLVSQIAKIPFALIEENSSLRDDLGIDSLQMVNLIVMVSEKFGLDLNQVNSLEDMHTVERMYHIFAKGG